MRTWGGVWWSDDAFPWRFFFFFFFFFSFFFSLFFFSLFFFGCEDEETHAVRVALGEMTTYEANGLEFLLVVMNMGAFFFSLPFRVLQTRFLRRILLLSSRAPSDVAQIVEKFPTC